MLVAISILGPTLCTHTMIATLSSPVPFFSHSGLPHNETTIAKSLKTVGYSTAMVGKWHLGVGENNTYLPINYGFDYYMVRGEERNHVKTLPSFPLKSGVRGMLRDWICLVTAQGIVCVCGGGGGELRGVIPPAACRLLLCQGAPVV